MEVDGWVSNSCACTGISNLGLEQSARGAMFSFCLKALVKGSSAFTGGGAYKTLSAHYTFIAGPEIGGFKESKKWVRYGSEFAAFLRKSKLGRIVTSGPALNRKHHSADGTSAQVWVWTPTQAAVEAWWEANKPDYKAPPAPRIPGIWDTARGAANNPMYGCPHCAPGTMHASGIRIYALDGAYYCEAFGLAHDKMLKEEKL